MALGPVTDHDMKVYVIIIIAAIILCSAGYGLVQFAQPVQAASVAKQQEDGTCVEFATVGTYKISHCLDPNGNEFEASTSGMIIGVGN